MLTHGSEAWNLAETTRAMINGCNARCLSHFTGLTAHAEASALTRTLDLVVSIRQRRYRWLGHILRMPDNRMVKEAVKVIFYSKTSGNIFMDTPPDLSFDELVTLTKDRMKWRLAMPGLMQKETLVEREETEKEIRENLRKKYSNSSSHSAIAQRTTQPCLCRPPR